MPFFVYLALSALSTTQQTNELPLQRLLPGFTYIVYKQMLN